MGYAVNRYFFICSYGLDCKTLAFPFIPIDRRTDVNEPDSRSWVSYSNRQTRQKYFPDRRDKKTDAHERTRQQVMVVWKTRDAERPRETGLETPRHPEREVLGFSCNVTWFVTFAILPINTLIMDVWPSQSSQQPQSSHSSQSPQSSQSSQS